MNYAKVIKFLEKLETESIAWKTKFYLRQPKKITATNYLLSFFSVLSKGTFSFRIWSCELSLLSKEKISFQAIAKKLGDRHLSFATTIFTKAIQKNIGSKLPKCQNGIFDKFSRVIIEDSTCVKLAKELFHHFSGANNGTKHGTVCRIQFAFDLIKGKFVNGELTTYTQNDTSYSKSILDSLCKGDLLIRDLGYFTIEAFKIIIKKEAWFLSRLRNGIMTFNPISGSEFQLVKELKKLDRLGIVEFDQELLLTKKHKLKARVVGVKLSEKQAKKRRDFAKKTRRRSKTTKHSHYLMSWSLYATNVPEEIWSIQNIFEAYSFRWEIEMMFKTWKSVFKIDKFMQNFKQSDPIKPEIILMLCLSFLAIVYKPQFNYYYKKILKTKNLHLSPYKFAQFIKSYFSLFVAKSEKGILTLLENYCCYNIRHDRENIYQKLFAT